MSNLSNDFLSPWAVLCVDDDPLAVDLLKTAVNRFGAKRIFTAQNAFDARNVLSRESIDLILLDIFMPEVSGLELLPEIVRQYPETQIIMVTGYNDAMTAVQCLRDGACDYLVKPIRPESLGGSLQKAVSRLEQIRNKRSSFSSIAFLSSLQKPEAFKSLVAESDCMQVLFKYLEAQASSPDCIFFSGKSGVGKRSLAKAVHHLSEGKPDFVEWTIPEFEELLKTPDPSSFLNLPSGTTLYVPEFDLTSKAAQEKIPTFLRQVRGRIKIVFSSRKNIPDLLTHNRILDSTYRALQVNHLYVPSLKERKDDILPLLLHFFSESCRKRGLHSSQLTFPSLQILQEVDFRDNLHDLKALAEKLADAKKENNLTDSSILQIFGDLIREKGERLATATGGIFFSLFPGLHEASDTLIREALKRSGGVQREAARMLNIASSSMCNHVKRIKENESREP